MNEREALLKRIAAALIVCGDGFGVQVTRQGDSLGVVDPASNARGLCAGDGDDERCRAQSSELTKQHSGLSPVVSARVLTS